jgi:hypothetical protein
MLTYVPVFLTTLLMPFVLVVSATDSPHKISINAIADTALKVLSAGIFYQNRLSGNGYTRFVSR